MAQIDKYPNGWKSGYSSADDPDLVGYSPAAWERAGREGMRRSQEDELMEARIQKIAENEQKRNERMEAENARREWQEQQMRMQSNENVELRKKAVEIMVEQKRVEYDNHNFLKKAVLKIQGKSFDQKQFKVIIDARKTVSGMSNEEVKDFVDTYEGRKR